MRHAILLPLLLLIAASGPLALPGRAADDTASNASDSNQPSGVDVLVELLSQIDDPALDLDLLKGMHDALRGRKQVPMPAGWQRVFARLQKSPNVEVRERATVLALTFGDQQAIMLLQTTLQDKQQPATARLKALQALIDGRVPKLSPLLFKLLDEPELRSAAIRALAADHHADTPPLLLQRYASLSESEKQDVIGTLTSRPDFALALLAAIEADKLPGRELSAFNVRQLQAFNHPEINERLNQVWGTVRPTSAQKAELMARYKKLLAPEVLKAANPMQGRAVFARTCQQCHRLYDAGGDVGPELTGSNRSNLDYVLENVLDPSAVIGRDFKLVTVVTVDGRLISGIIREQNDKTLLIQTTNDRIILPREDIDELVPSAVSMMPEGAFEKLSNEEIRDLVSYLATKQQVALPPDFTATPAPPTTAPTPATK